MNKILTVLFAEDDADIRAIAEMSLEDEGFKLISCESGQVAIQKAAECMPDLILLDVMMPGLDGPATLRQLREFEHLSHTPVIFMTAKVQPAEINQYRSLGAIGVISKPFDPIQLPAEIHQLMQQETKPNAPLTPSEKIQSLQTQFSDSLAARLANIEKCWQKAQHAKESDEATLLLREVHSLAGAAATFGFIRLSPQALALESMLVQFLQSTEALQDFKSIDQAITTLQNLAKEGPDQVIEIPQQYPSDNSTSLANDDDFIVYMLESDAQLVKTIMGQLRHFGYKVQDFSSPELMQEAIVASCPDALLLNITETTSNQVRWQTATELRAAAKRNIPVIFLSSNESWQDRLNAVRANGDAYLTKPVNIDELVEQLDQLSGKTHADAFRILIVDDTVLLAEHYARVLQSAGMKTRVVCDPKALLSVLPDFIPDLVLMDLYMPECTGVEAARVIRQHAAYINLPIVYLSTEKNFRQQLKALRAGGDDFLQKPIEDDDLVLAVNYRVARFRQLISLMNTDGLTGLTNHINLKLSLEREINTAKRRGEQLCFAMLDIDDFKSINDRFGHPAGDRVIKSLARLLKFRLRKSDMAARYGGEEFAVVLPHTSMVHAQMVLEELRKVFTEINFIHEGISFTVTFSAGIAAYRGKQDMHKLIACADEALYQAKREGKNRVQAFSGKPAS